MEGGEVDGAEVAKSGEEGGDEGSRIAGEGEGGAEAVGDGEELLAGEGEWLEVAMVVEEGEDEFPALSGQFHCWVSFDSLWVSIDFWLEELRVQSELGAMR